MPSRATRERYSFANLDEALELPDLIAVQRESFRWFLEEGLAETFRDISPIKDFTETLMLELEFDPNDEDLRPPPKFSVEECKEKDMTYSAPIFVRARFMNQNTGEIKEQTVFMGDFPMMTEKGTFVINGTERVVVSQLVRSPGVIFQPGERYRLRNLAKHQLVTGTIHPYRGEWIEFDVEQKPGKDPTAGTRVARKRRLSIFILLRALGYGDDHCPGFLEAFVREFDFLEGQWEKERELAPTQEEALVEIYKRARPGEPPSVESARNYFRTAFFENRRYDLSRVGRYKLNRKLGAEIDNLAATFPMLAGANADGVPFLDRPDDDSQVLTRSRSSPRAPTCCTSPRARQGYRLDDQDHFANRRIRSVGELIQNQVRIGLSRMERVVKERMTTQDVEAITPQTLINIRPVVAAIKEFFGTSQLSQFMDQVNPLSGLTHRRRLSALGPGGLSPGAGRLRRPRRPLLPLRPHVPDRDAGGPQHRPHRRPGHLRPGEPVRLHRVAVPQGRSTARSPTTSCGWPPTRRSSTSSPRPTPRSTTRATSSRTASSPGGRRRPPRCRTCGSSSSATSTSRPPPRSPRCRPPRSSSWTSRRSRSSRSPPPSSRSSSTTTPTGRSWAPTCRSRPCRWCAPRRPTSAPASRAAPPVTRPT